MIITSILLILGWTELFKQTFDLKGGFQYKYSSLVKAIDIKPINCAYCLSFWLGLALSIIFLDVAYMAIFLFYVLKTND